MDETTTQRPAQTFRQGAIGLSVWQRDGKRGPFFEFTVSRSYKKSDDEAGYSNSFRAENIEGLRTVLNEVETWLKAQGGQMATIPTELERPHVIAEQYRS